MPYVRFVDAQAGNVRQVEIPDEMTLRDFLGDLNIPTETHLVRLNRQTIESLDHPLREGDFVSVTPTKIQGA